MKIVADTHVHIYSCYDLHKFSSMLEQNLKKVGAGQTIRLGFLTERSDCNFFDDIKSGNEKIISECGNIQLGPDESSLIRDNGSGEKCILLPGRQVVAKERIEILALATTAKIPDGMQAVDIVTMILDNGGVPVVAWAPGKWFGERGNVVRSLLDGFNPARLLIGDSSMRPTIWAEPFIMREARKQGYRIIAGSDPLPFAGEESMAGTYCSVFDTTFGLASPLASARNMLWNACDIVTVGKRGTALKTLYRMYKNSKSK
jgi:hypothetical protein